MAKTPPPSKSSKARASVKAKVTAADLSSSDIGGESPEKAPVLPADAAILPTYAEAQGSGGETHQVAGGDIATLTTQHGIPVADDQNSLKQGARGPALLEDAHFREKMFHFDHERIPERVVHARGYGAHGYFELTESLADITRADVFQRVGDALVFELSKVERPDIRSRTVSHLIHVDAALAETVADGLGIGLPEAAVAARAPINDLPPSNALSIVKNGPDSFKGRKLGILLSDGTDAAIFKALLKAIDDEGAVYEVIAPKIAGVTLSDGTIVAAKHKVDGGPSVLFDAVAILVSAEGAASLALDAAARDFVTDAFVHCKYIGIGKDAEAIFVKAGIAEDLDEACLPIAKPSDAKAFIQACRALRHWPREAAVDLDAQPES